MNHLKIINFKAYWDFDNHFGKVELFFDNGQHLDLPGEINSSDFSAILSMLQFPNATWHLPTRSIVKG